ncbi:uncharacterized protein J3R85_014265 [Psidium guajava]|nr:uncharacterized protein J3R85_014265 [Psidium guajava]
MVIFLLLKSGFNCAAPISYSSWFISYRSKLVWISGQESFIGFENFKYSSRQGMGIEGPLSKAGSHEIDMRLKKM